MHQSDYLLEVLIFLTAMVVIVPVFQRLKLSSILGYLAAGMLIGPHGLGLIGDTKAAETLAQFGVVFLLFMIGLELSFRQLRALGSQVFGLGSLQVMITGLLIGLVAYAVGFNVTTATIVGGGLALSSTAFVLQLLEDRGERATRFGLTAFSILLLQDLAVVPLLIFLSLASTSDASLLETLGFATLRGIGALIIVFTLGRYLLRPLYKAIAVTRSTELFVAATLLTILGMAWITSIAGLSMELGALLAGLLLSETKYRHQIEADIKPFRGLLLGLFFMTIGMAINFEFIIANVGLIIVLVLCLMLGKALVTTLLCRLLSTPFSTSARTGLALSQGGEFGFVIFGAALALGLLTETTTQILLAVVALSMVATPTAFFLGQLISATLTKRSGTTDEALVTNISIKENHVLIAGFGRVGQTVSNVISDAGIPYVALDIDEAQVRKARKRGLSVFYGDAGLFQVLKAAGADNALSIVVTIDQANTASRIVTALRAYYPDLPIYVRARDQQHRRSLEKLGASDVVSEAAESSLQLGGIVLNNLGISADEITSLIQSYRDDDYARLENIFINTE